MIFREPLSPKNDATLAAFWLPQAAVYLVANCFNWLASTGAPPEVQLVSRTSGVTAAHMAQLRSA